MGRRWTPSSALFGFEEEVETLLKEGLSDGKRGGNSAAI